MEILKHFFQAVYKKHTNFLDYNVSGLITKASRILNTAAQPVRSFKIPRYAENALILIYT